MKSNKVIIALPALAGAVQAPIPAAAGMANLLGRQLVPTAITTTTTTTASEARVTQDSPSACSSSYSSMYSAILTAPGAPTYPSALDDFYDQLSRTATTDFVCAVGSATLPPALSSMEDAYQSSIASFADGGRWNTEAPPQCSDLWLSIVRAPVESASSQAASCRSAASATATRATNATSSATGTASSSAAVPANTGAAGRNLVSAGLAVGAAAVVGYLGMV
ncbi:uncharacterized protein PpBr36_10244 [Pyricularia pennisetigena]|uniref:uncharacterized protein n=1 Tax=Pyricularia pennisetigena TaxID=1578925 RepID=UPI00114E4D02|nr:uncharacterized protein PpBr36_10244 [Pyricularia pennisetigena]TLS21396.1 hypothetical protein PpBr36_10244 [Pyricularia pennisetigena]